VKHKTSFWELMTQQMPGQHPELARYALVDSTKSITTEIEQSFAVNVLEKVLTNHVERVKTRVSLTYMMQLMDSLLVDVKLGCSKFNERLAAQQQYHAILSNSNAFSQNRKAVEAFAVQANVGLTHPVNMAQPMHDTTRSARKSWFQPKRTGKSS